MNKQCQREALVFAGALPFLLAIFLKLFGDSHTANTVFLSYAVVIISFISGSHWGIFLTHDCPRNLLIESNVLTLLAWVALLIHQQWSLVLTLGAFIYLLSIDATLHKAAIISSAYWTLRKRITGVVVVLHILFIGLVVLSHM